MNRCVVKIRRLERSCEEATERVRELEQPFIPDAELQRFLETTKFDYLND